MYDESKAGFNLTMAMGLAFLLILALGSIGYWVLYPAILHQQADASLNSAQFAISGQKDISDAMETYDRLQTQIDELASKTDAASVKLVEDFQKQQVGVVCDVRQAVNLLPEDKVPARAKTFLTEHVVNCK